MRLFSCFLDFRVSDELIEDALRPRQPYGKEEWTDYGNEAQEAAEAADSSALVRGTVIECKCDFFECIGTCTGTENGKQHGIDIDQQHAAQLGACL